MGKLISDIPETRTNTKRKEQNLPTKLVIRRLPPTLTEEELKAKLQPLPQHDYFLFVGPNYSFGKDGFTRAYINFIEYNDVIEFRNNFDGFLFYDNLGNEFSAVIEYAPCQQIPRIKQKIDQKINTIDKDPDYLQFLENLGKQVELLPSAEKFIEELQMMTTIDKRKEKIRTPLTDYLKEKRDIRIAARQMAVAQREKERKQRLEEKEKRKEREKEREKERKSKQDKERFERKNVEKETKSEKKENRKEKASDDTKGNDTVVKAENAADKPTEQSKGTDPNRIKHSENKKRYTERHDKYREKEERQSRSGRTDGGQDKYSDDRYYVDVRKFRNSRDKESKKIEDPKERNNFKESEMEKTEKSSSNQEVAKKVKQEQEKNEEPKSVNHNNPTPVSSEESGKLVESSSIKSVKKPRPEIKIYRPPSDRSSSAKSVKADERKDTDKAKGEKLKSNREKTRDYPRSSRYDKYDKPHSDTRKKTERLSENENRSSRDNKSDSLSSYDRSPDKILEKVKPDVNKISDKDEKTAKKSNAEIERDKELEQERYRMNWLVKQ